MSLNTPFEPWLKRKRGLISEAGHAAINRQWIKVGKVFVVNCPATWTSLRTGVKTLIARNYMKWFYQYINRQNQKCLVPKEIPNITWNFTMNWCFGHWPLWMTQIKGHITLNVQFWQIPIIDSYCLCFGATPCQIMEVPNCHNFRVEVNNEWGDNYRCILCIVNCMPTVRSW